MRRKYGTEIDVEVDTMSLVGAGAVECGSMGQFYVCMYVAVWSTSGCGMNDGGVVCSRWDGRQGSIVNECAGGTMQLSVWSSKFYVGAGSAQRKS